MIEINIGALVVLLGIPTAVTGFCFWLLEHRIQKREKQKEAEEAKHQQEAAARDRDFFRREPAYQKGREPVCPGRPAAVREFVLL